MFNRQKLLFLLQPLAASLLSSAAFFAIIFLFFRPGYAVNDDISIISLASGYLGGKPLPFLVYSNVLLGLVLNPLYGAAPTINWEILFFILINFLSVWALVYIFLASLPTRGLKLFAVGTIFCSDTYFLINITYTMIAAFTTLAGLCLILSVVQSQTGLKKGTLIFGCALALAGSLIRLKSMLLIGGLSLPIFVLNYHPAQIKKNVLAFSLLAVLVSIVYLFDRFYLQASPDWYSYQSYDSVRSELHDTPRKINIEPAYPQIGWSRNDVKLFFDWFFPDKQIYSLENLQYLVEHVPGNRADKTSTLIALSYNLFEPAHWPYLLLILSTWLLALFYGPAKKAGIALLILLMTFLAFDFYLVWALKIPDRISISLVAAAAIFSLYLLAGFNPISSELLSQVRRNHQIRFLMPIAAVAVISVIACGLVINQSIATTSLNIKNQAAYLNVLVDIQNLRDNGKISKNALIISPAYGFPLEWANPLSLNLPTTQVLEMGWLTFSPAYEKVLSEFGAQPIPETFYKKDNIYLMTRSASLSEILDFIKEHKGLEVGTTLIYQIPATDVGLYKLWQSPSSPVPRVP